MFKKLMAVAFGVIFAVSLAVSLVANAADNPFIQGDYEGAIADLD